MFKLKLFDSQGSELNEGDIVQVSINHRDEHQFYAEVKYIESEGIITPFHTFSFHHFTKVAKVPDNAVRSSENRYGIWFVNESESNKEEAYQRAEKYLMDWRVCEHLLSERCFRIEKEFKSELF